MTEQTPNKADLLLPLTMAAMSNSYDNEETADEDGFPDDSPQKKSNPTKKQERVENNQNDTPVLDKFGNDITKAAEEGNLDPVVGRATEIERVIQILSRRKKNNPVLIGEPGVGKSAIVEGLAIRIKASYPLTWQPLSLEQNSEASLKNASKQSSTRLKRIQT